MDDLGRQRCSAAELLNRWIIPLENRVDYLTLSTGKKIQVPFEQVVVFATNLTVSDLADEAFLRRMGYRMYVMPPGPDTFAQIFVRHARARGLAVDTSILAHLEKRYGVERRTPKACEPRDLIDRAIEVCRYRREPIRLTQERPGPSLGWILRRRSQRLTSSDSIRYLRPALPRPGNAIQ